MDVYNQMREVVKQREITNSESKRKYKDLCRKRLVQILRKKFQTCFIGAISEIEKNFGYLWGYGKDQSSLTDTQLTWKKKWDEIRNKLLNSGNNQIRGMEAELERNDIVWKRYEAELLTELGRDILKNREENNV